MGAAHAECRNKLEPSGLGLPFKADERQAGFYFCNALMQLMEDVYLDLNLEEENDHPDNSGWMNLFRHWAWSAMFRATWVISASCYGAQFRSFCENELDLDLATTGQVKIVPANYNSAQLNYRAKEMLAAAGFEHHGQKLYLAHTAAGELAYLRVQEHLRDMGLARRILDAMVVEGQCLVSRKALWHELPVGFPEPVTPENKERIERLLESAHMRRAGFHDAKAAALDTRRCGPSPARRRGGLLPAYTGLRADCDGGRASYHRPTVCGAGPSARSRKRPRAAWAMAPLSSLWLRPG